MHLVPYDRRDRRIIDDHRVCQAIEGIGDPARVQDWARRLQLLGDPTRLTLLLCIRHAEEICVSDLAVAAGISDTVVSQAMRLLGDAGIVEARRDGRVVRYRIAENGAGEIGDLLDRVGGTRASV